MNTCLTSLKSLPVTALIVISAFEEFSTIWSVSALDVESIFSPVWNVPTVVIRLIVVLVVPVVTKPVAPLLTPVIFAPIGTLLEGDGAALTVSFVIIRISKRYNLNSALSTLALVR